MMLTEITAVATAALPVQALKDHLRLGTGFGEDGLQDDLLVSHLRAALATIEGRTGKAILTRRFKLSLARWRSPDEQPLPVAPAVTLVSVSTVDGADSATVLAQGRFRLVQDGQRPRLVAAGVLFPAVPNDGRVEIVFDAGFGPAWADVPPDLAQAVLLLAASSYENRTESGGGAGAGGLPAAIQALIEPWRTVRVLGGGAA